MFSRRSVRYVLVCLAVQATLSAGWCVGPSLAGSHGSLPQQLCKDVPQELHAQALITSRASSRAERSLAKEGIAPGWARALLAALAVFAVVVGGVPHSARAQGGNVRVYFGQGCFWHVQNELANSEAKVLGRKDSEITALAGYAGGSQVGGSGEVCYHNMSGAPDYGDMGHTEVVKLDVPEDKIGDVSKVLLDFAASSRGGRHDPQDAGGEYRSAIGLPGGMDGPAFKQIEQVSNGKLEFVKGKGNDADTVGSKKIWVYDTASFPFYQGEVYHQFHDDMQDKYSDEYHQLKKTGVKSGMINRVSCPDQKIVNS